MANPITLVLLSALGALVVNLLDPIPDNRFSGQIPSV